MLNLVCPFTSTSILATLFALDHSPFVRLSTIHFARALGNRTICGTRETEAFDVLSPLNGDSISRRYTSNYKIRASILRYTSRYIKFNNKASSQPNSGLQHYISREADIDAVTQAADVPARNTASFRRSRQCRLELDFCWA